MRLAEAQITAAIEPVLDSQDRRQDDHLEVSIRIRKTRPSSSERLSVRRFLQPGPLWWAFDWESARQASPTQPVARADARSRSRPRERLRGADRRDRQGGHRRSQRASGGSRLGRIHSAGIDETPSRSTGEPPLVIITTNEERVLPNAFAEAMSRLAVEAAR